MPTLRKRQSQIEQTNAKTPKEESEEEDVNAPPRGTSDEESSSDDEQSDGLESTPRRPRQAEPTLEEKLAQNNETKKGLRSPPSSTRKRKTKEMLGSDDFDGGIFSDIIGASQRRSSQPRYSYSSKFRKTPSSSIADSLPPSSASLPKSSSTSVSRQVDSPGENVDSLEEKEDGKHEFKVPRDFDTELPPLSPPNYTIPDSDDDSPLSSAVSYDSSDVPMKEEGDVKDNSEPAEYLCPMCKEPVEPEPLIKFRAQPRQRIRDQYVFCESHKKSSVEQEWKDKGYPTIDWDTFEERIKGHFNDLEKFMVPESSSYYRNVLDSTLKSGKAKNFRLTLSGDALETISCGYYGTRGSGRMLQTITTRFARKLRRLATEDHIVKQAGVVAYSQAVLVPELAVIFIKEDMGVDDDSARQIMRESIDLGEKLNPAPNDIVPVTKENDDENGIPN
ncbi:RTC4-like domain-containing protein [Aspergillus aurantiobrunneus]